MAQFKISTTDLNLSLGFHLLVILTKLVTGQAREPLLATPERSRIIYLYTVCTDQYTQKLKLSDRKLGIQLLFIIILSLSKLPCTLQLEKAVTTQ